MWPATDHTWHFTHYVKGLSLSYGFNTIWMTGRLMCLSLNTSFLCSVCRRWNATALLMSLSTKIINKFLDQKDPDVCFYLKHKASDEGVNPPGLPGWCSQLCTPGCGDILPFPFSAEAPAAGSAVSLQPFLVLLWCLGHVPGVIVLLEGELSAQHEVLRLGIRYSLNVSLHLVPFQVGFYVPFHEERFLSARLRLMVELLELSLTSMRDLWSSASETNIHPPCICVCGCVRVWLCRTCPDVSLFVFIKGAANIALHLQPLSESQWEL